MSPPSPHQSLWQYCSRQAQHQDSDVGVVALLRLLLLYAPNEHIVFTTIHALIIELDCMGGGSGRGDNPLRYREGRV